MRRFALVLLLLLFGAALFGQEGQIRLLVFRDGEVREVALAIARATGLNLLVDSSVSGAISLHLQKVSPSEALSLLAQAVGARLVKTENGLLLTKQPPAPLVQVEVQGEKASVQAQGAEAADLLRQLAEKGKVNLILPSDLPQSRVTVSLSEVPIEEALRWVAKAAGWEVQKEGVLFWVQRRGLGEPVVPSPPPSLPPRPPTPPPVVSEGQREPEKATPPRPPAPLSRSGRVTLTAINAPLSAVLDEIARQTGIDLLFVGSGDEKVTVKLTEVPVEEALRLVLAGTKYLAVPLEREGNPDNPSSSQAPKPQRFLIGELGDPAKWASPALARWLTTKRIALNYLRAEQVPQLLSPAVPTGIVKVLADQNALLVTAPADLLERVEREVREADQPAKQVVIEAQVWEVSERGLSQLAMALGGQKGMAKGEVGTATFPGLLFVVQEGANLAGQFFGQLQALKEKGEARTLAQPKVAAVSGKKASIEVVQELYFRTAPFLGQPSPQPTPLVPFFQLQAISAGVKLEVVPLIGAKGDILLEITPEVSSVVGLTAEGLPQLATRKATATVWVKEGETVILGGLRQREESRVTTKVPFLSEIPFLGELFKSRRKEVRESELVILLTPRKIGERRKEEG